MEQPYPCGHGSGGEEFVGIAAIAIVVRFAIQIVVCLLLYTCFKRIPGEHQKMPAGQVRLPLVPIFNVVRKVFVYLRLAESFPSYFESIGKTDVGDCG